MRVRFYKLAQKIQPTILILFVTLLALFSWERAQGCTSAIFTGKVTADGRPIIWKHRDTKIEDNRVDKYSGERYTFLSLVSSNTKGQTAWSGVNDAGFSIMNTASYNLNADKDFKKRSVAFVMFKALGSCATLGEFEALLDNYKELGLEANIGVIDAKGGAAYYECSRYGWVKKDLNDPKVAPNGYLIYTNFSFTGEEDKGSGYIRYNSASSIVEEAIAAGKKISAEWIASSLSRSFRHSMLGKDLAEETLPNGYFMDQDFIPRKSSVSATIVQGVNRGEDPTLAVMWTMLGYPPLSMAVPTMVNADIPNFMGSSSDNPNSQLCDLVLAVKYKRIFDVKRGSGEKYFNYSTLYKEYITPIAPIEHSLFKSFDSLRESALQGKKFSYKNLKKSINGAYKEYKKVMEK
ncbi:MAG: hypothetical protein WC960_03050 [Bacteroidales bacterium]